MTRTFDLTGKIVAITGGYGYLGVAIVESLLHHGATVYVLGRTESKFKEAFSGFLDADNAPKFTECDISDSESVQLAFKIIDEAEGHIDVLINNAFYLKGQHPFTMSDVDFATGIDGTLNSVFRATRDVIPYIRKSLAGRIINVSSMYGIVAPDFSVYDENPEMWNPPHYGAAKAGVGQLTRYYASALGKEGITVNAVAPGPFPSTQVQKKSEFIEKLGDKTCLGRIGQPEELAGIFVYLASDSSSYTTGQTFSIDGGWTSR
jgi:NAD(P)-dependent dehydrogenase (short-subunit alcohol dehydrogenase family)